MQPVDVLGHDGHFETRFFKRRPGVFVRRRLRPGVRCSGAGQGFDRDVRVVRPQPAHLVEHAPVQEPARARVLAERAQGAVLLRVVRLPDRKQRVQRRRRADADAVRVDVRGAGDGFAKRGHARLGARARAGEEHHARDGGPREETRRALDGRRRRRARAAPERPPLRGHERLRVISTGFGIERKGFGFRFFRYQSRRRRRRTETRAVRRSLRGHLDATPEKRERRAKHDPAKHRRRCFTTRIDDETAETALEAHRVLDERLHRTVREARRAPPGNETEADHFVFFIVYNFAGACHVTNAVSVREAEELTRQAAPVARGGGGGALRSLGRRRGRDARDDGREKRRRSFFAASRRARVVYVILRRSLALRLSGVGAAGPRADRADRGSADRDDRGAPTSRARERGEQSRRTPPRVVVVVGGVGVAREDRHEVGFAGDERAYVVRVVGVPRHDASGVAAAAGAELARARGQERVHLARVFSGGQVDHGDGQSAAAKGMPRLQADPKSAEDRVFAPGGERARPAALGPRDRRGERSDVRGEDHGAGTTGRRRLHRPPPRRPPRVSHVGTPGKSRSVSGFFLAAACHCALLLD